MNFHQPTAEIYIPDAMAVPQALARTTHLCLAAHQDDIEIMSIAPILACYQQPQQWFTGVVMADGAGSPRSGAYAHFTDEEMRVARHQEQRAAAALGAYAAVIMLDHPSATIKDASQPAPVRDLLTLLRATRPQVVYTHALTDKHDTHVAVALRVVQALRLLEPEERPAQVIGCEVWRGLDWIQDDDKVRMDASGREHLQAALIGAFDSQIAGGKRYDLAALGRRHANATFATSHRVDAASGVVYGMDMTPLMVDTQLDACAYARQYIKRFAQDVADRIRRMT